MTFEISLSDCFFSQRWAALKEVSLRKRPPLQKAC